MSLGYRTVLFSPLVPDGVGAESVASGVTYRWRAVSPWDAGAGSGGMETQWSPLLVISGAAVTKDLPITPAGNGLDVEITVIVDGKPVTRTETIAVPTGTGTIDYYNTVTGEGPVLQRLDRSTLTPAVVVSNAAVARIAVLEATVAALSAGASNLAGITDMSAYMRTVNIATTAGAARTTLGAADDTLVVHLAGVETLTGAKTVGDLTVTTTATVPTPTATGHATTKAYVDSAVSGGTIPDATATVKGKIKMSGDLAGVGSTADAPVVLGLAALNSTVASHTTTLASHTASLATLQAGTPWIRETSPGVYPARPVTTQIVVWLGSVAQVFGGTTSSGTTAVAGLDAWFNTA